MKVIIAGSRNFNDYDFLCAKIEELNLKIDEIVCGGCCGADSLGAQYGIDNGITVTMFPAEWNKYGRSAGIIRNHKMGDYADYLIAFWDGQSRGTKDMINYMKKINKHGSVIMVKIL